MPNNKSVEGAHDISYALRLLPGSDLRLSIENFVNENEIKAGWIVTCAGSLTAWSIRFANQGKPANGIGYFEIISLTGTVSLSGCHLHISIADDKGEIIGGHLLHDCKIYTTAEIILVESGTYIFSREKDDDTGWSELRVNEK